MLSKRSTPVDVIVRVQLTDRDGEQRRAFHRKQQWHRRQHKRDRQQRSFQHILQAQFRQHRDRERHRQHQHVDWPRAKWQQRHRQDEGQREDEFHARIQRVNQALAVSIGIEKVKVHERVGNDLRSTGGRRGRAIAPQIRHAKRHKKHDDDAEDSSGDGGRIFIGDARHHIVRNDVVRIGLRFLEETLLCGDIFQPIRMCGSQRRGHGQRDGDQQSGDPHELATDLFLIGGLDQLGPHRINQR